MLIHMMAVAAAAAGVASSPAAEWSFGVPADAATWRPNSHIAGMRFEDGVLAIETTGHDPFLQWQGEPFETTPWDYVLLRARADKPGAGELFWTGAAEGPYGGFSQEKTTAFTLRGTGDWESVLLFPFWQGEERIRKLRFDLYGDASFALDTLRIQCWQGRREPLTDVYAWSFPEDAPDWFVPLGFDTMYAPPMHLDIDGRAWVSLTFDANEPTQGRLLWASHSIRGEQYLPFEILPGTRRTINIPMAGLNEWQSPLATIGIHISEAAGVRLHALAIAETPLGPADLHLLMFGFDEAVNRAGNPARLVAIIENRGGEASPETPVSLMLPRGFDLSAGGGMVHLAPLQPEQRVELEWTVTPGEEGHHSAALTIGQGEAAADGESELRVEPAVDAARADYVPEPQPVETDIEVLAYYFPGWDTDAKWDPIRNTAPIRKPLLGYYDEANPEVVDWQIKWAVENGISCFLVDWYWSEGSQFLRHWFDAYREARYRDYLDVAIMWANHNPPDTHSPEDWAAVTQEWIDRYFNLHTYYRLDGKPAVFIWAPDNIRRDLGGSDAVKAVLGTSQQMAREAGYPGIAYVALGPDSSPARIQMLEHEGYMGFTTYHEWGKAVDLSPVPLRAHFQDVVETAPDAWREKQAVSASLAYYPVADTGWDSRPWHGARGLAIEGRTPAHFEQILRDLKVFAEEFDKHRIVVGPVNEWGEGSYIEPNREFGFEMYEAIRRVFARGAPDSWPVNLAPADLALGPYDFPPGETRSAWSFGGGLGDWRALMNVENLRAEDGAMRFRSATDDPAVMIETPGFAADDWNLLIVEMQLEGHIPPGNEGQLYWTPAGGAQSEDRSVRFQLRADAGKHIYRIRLDTNPNWTGEMESLRFDPCAAANIEVTVHSLRFEKQ